MTSTSACMIDCPKGMCLGSSDVFIFWEISASISEMVQDSDRVAVEGYCIWPVI